MKIADINNNEGRHYLRTWIKALGVMLGWPQRKTLEWAEQWKDDLNDYDSLFFNRTPGRYILDLIIPEPLKGTLCSGERIVLRHIVLRVIEWNDSSCYRKRPDWSSIKRRVDKCLADIDQKKRKSRGSIEPFLEKYERKLPRKKPTKRLEKILRKTYIS